MGGEPSPTGSPGLGPTERELRLYARILLHIGRQPVAVQYGTTGELLTQEGMAAALGTSRANISLALRRLVDGGAVRVERGHVQHQRQRLKVYLLASRGEELVRHIRDTMGP